MTLNEAIAARTAARAKLAADADATANGRATANAARVEVERIAEFERTWIERHALTMRDLAQSGTALTGKIDSFELDDEQRLVTPPSTAGAIMAKRHAEITLAAAEQAVTRLEADEQAARAALTEAESAVHKASSAAFAAKAREALENLRRVNAVRRQLREHLLGAYRMVIGLREAHKEAPETLTAAEWHEVNQPPGEFSAELMNLGMPIHGTSMYSPEAFGGDGRGARRRVDAEAVAWQELLNELQAHGASDETPVAKQQAVA